MQYRIDHALAILSKTPVVVRNLLQGLDEPWVMNNYGENTFSPFDVVGHFVHGEKEDWIGRTKIILEHGEAQPFDPFDRYAQYEDSKGKTINNLLDEFASLRSANLNELKTLNLEEEQLALRGTHPELGGVTLNELLATWVTHDLHHIAQICKSMAYQYKDEVGPWRKYIGIIPP